METVREKQRILLLLKGPWEPKSSFPSYVGPHYNFLDKGSCSLGSNTTCDDATELHCYTAHMFLGSSPSSADQFHLFITPTSLCPLGSRVKYSLSFEGRHIGKNTNLVLSSDHTLSLNSYEILGRDLPENQFPHVKNEHEDDTPCFTRIVG